MTFTVATFTVLLLAAMISITVFILLGRQIAALHRRSQTRQDWNTELSVDRYRPMFRLLADDDVRFLQSQPGATPAMVQRLRRQRCEVFRGYLRSLERDFQQASDALILVMIQSQTDRKDLLTVLVDSKLKFSLGVFSLRCRLMLYRWNVGEEPVARLVSLFEGIQRELQAFAPMMQPVDA